MYRGGLLLVLAALLAASGCGEDATTTSERLTLAKCSDAGGLTAAGWGGSVNGISCGAAGRFIQDHALRDFTQPAASTRAAVRRSPSGSFSSASFQCRYRPLDSGWGWHVSCIRPGQAVSFQVTP
jgi:hypothetical protein